MRENKFRVLKYKVDSLARTYISFCRCRYSPQTSHSQADERAEKWRPIPRRGPVRRHLATPQISFELGIPRSSHANFFCLDQSTWAVLPDIREGRTARCRAERSLRGVSPEFDTFARVAVARYVWAVLGTVAATDWETPQAALRYHFRATTKASSRGAV